MTLNNTIVAISTGSAGAISIVRLSGEESIAICSSVFEARNKELFQKSNGFTLHYGNIMEQDSVIDDVLVSVFKAPRSYTGEDMVEISCHGSQYIQQKIVELCVANGAQVAQGGDFTMRAYANGKLDLVQAEAVADVIASTSESNHRLAMNQMRGGYIQEFSHLRAELINLMSLLELELDFSEEDVEFADRTKLVELLNNTKFKIDKLVSSFQQGNAIKNGVPVAIVGKPNVGKSTLLNRLLNDDRAMVSPIAGTTRDVIEECIVLSTVTFRFIDTAGIHFTEDILENMGIQRTLKMVEKASLVMLLVVSDMSTEDIQKQIEDLHLEQWQDLIILRNKVDIESEHKLCDNLSQQLGYDCFEISAKGDIGITSLTDYLSNKYSNVSETDVIISNMRHYELLNLAEVSLNRVLSGISDGIPTDFLAQDLRETLHHIGLITGQISSDDILHNIFKSFCIGK